MEDSKIAPPSNCACLHAPLHNCMCLCKARVTTAWTTTTKVSRIPSVEIFCLLLPTVDGRRNCRVSVRKANLSTTTPTLCGCVLFGQYNGQWEQLSFWHFLALPIRYIMIVVKTDNFIFFNNIPSTGHLLGDTQTPENTHAHNQHTLKITAFL